MPESPLQGASTLRILVGKTFGIGNAVMAIPMIRCLQKLGEVDILVGSLPDDFGAAAVLSKVVCGQGKLYFNTALERHYDVAVMAIPFDGRWRNGVHYNAAKTMDERPRPVPSVPGLLSWEKHECSYQIENALELGFDVSNRQEIDYSFMPKRDKDKSKVYLGVGYKRDVAGFWQVKHWGNKNYADFIKLLLTRFPEKTVVSTGSIQDVQGSLQEIGRLVNDPRFSWSISKNLYEAFDTVIGCGTYFGNDTGMMHVAASANLKVLGLFFMENAVRKNAPLCSNRVCIEAPNKDAVSPQYALERFIELESKS